MGRGKMIVALEADRVRQVRLQSLSQFESFDAEPLRIGEVRGVVEFAAGHFRLGAISGSPQAGAVAGSGVDADNELCVLCLATKRSVIICHVSVVRQALRASLLPGELSVPAGYTISRILLHRELLFVNAGGFFAVYKLQLVPTTAPGAPPTFLFTVLFVSTTEQPPPHLNHFFASTPSNPLDTIFIVPLSDTRFFIANNFCGSFINTVHQSEQSTFPEEIAWPVVPLQFSYKDPYLVVHAENCVLFYDLTTGAWAQTLNLRRTRPLAADYSLLLSTSADSCSLVYLRDASEDADRIFLPLASSAGVKRKFTMRSRDDLIQSQKADKKLKPAVISGPVIESFRHIEHVGASQSPGLIDLAAVC